MRRNSRSGKKARGYVGLAVLALGTSWAVMSAVRMPAETPAAPQRSVEYLAEANKPKPTEERRTMAVVGDSFSLDKPEYWHRRTAACINLMAKVNSVGGSGFAQPGLNKQPFDFPERVQTVVAAKPDLLIFATAFNDAGYTEWQPQVVKKRILETIATYRSHLPETKMVIMGPFWAIDPLPKKITDNRDILAAAAAETGVTYVDSSQWVREDKDLADNDGQHPTESGHKLIADRLLAELRDAGLATPNSSCDV